MAAIMMRVGRISRSLFRLAEYKKPILYIVTAITTLTKLGGNHYFYLESTKAQPLDWAY